MRDLLRSPEFRIALAAAVIFSVFGLKSESFFTERIWRGILIAAGDLGFLVLGEALVITSGEIDLSIASTWALSAYIFRTLANAGVDPMLALIIVLFLGFLIGSGNGLFLARTGIPSFLVTLATMWIIRGVVFVINPTAYSYLKVETFLNNILLGYVGVIPAVFIWFVALATIFTILLVRTKFGSHVLAVGGNLTVARNLGVRIERTKTLCFILSSLMAALGGIAMIVEYKVMSPNSGMVATFGAGLEFEAIAICMMSGISPTGGRASIPAVFIAAVAYASFKSGLILFGLPGYWYLPFTGIMTFILVALHLVGKKRG
ncbi:MAG: ABC transporter permease [Nitrososphaeria archaeon]